MTALPKEKIALELARAVVEVEAFRRQRITLAANAVIGGVAGAVRLAMGVEDEDLAHVVVGSLAVLMIAGLALVLAWRAGRRRDAARRRAAVLDGMLRPDSLEDSSP